LNLKSNEAFASSIGVPNLIFFEQLFAGSYQQKTTPKTDYSALRMVKFKKL
jgi:hypothetical protein